MAPGFGPGPRPGPGYRPLRPGVPAADFSSTGCTVALRLLRPRDPLVEPVFVDGTGRRRVLLRALGAAVAAVSLTYLVLVGGGALTGAPRPQPTVTAPPPGVTNIVSTNLDKDQR